MGAVVASPESNVQEQHARIEALTGLRFFAAIYVVLFHLYLRDFAAKSKSLGAQFLSHGYLAVSFFFILSGFVLTWNYADRWSAESYPRFLVARLARIYPVYLLALFIQIPFYAPRLHPWPVIAVLCMIQSWTTLPSQLPSAWNFPAWTLSIEWFFYLCFPLLLFVVTKIKRRTTFIILIALVSLAVAGPQAAIGGRLSWFTRHIPLPVMRLPEFLLGMLLARSMPRAQPPSQLSINRTTSALLLITALLLTLNLHRFVLLVECTFAAILWLLTFRESHLKRWLESRPLVLLGGASYALYILQDPIHNWLDRWNAAYLHWPYMDQFLFPPLLVALSVIVFRYYEQPARRKIRSLAKRE